jgi:hypothetical protein
MFMFLSFASTWRAFRRCSFRALVLPGEQVSRAGDLKRSQKAALIGG